MKTLNINGKEYKLPSPTNQKVQQGFLDYCKDKVVKSPLALIKDILPSLSPEDKAIVIREALAQERQPLCWTNPEVQGELSKPSGVNEYVWLLWSFYQPDLTREQTWELHEQACKEQGESYLL